MSNVRFDFSGKVAIVTGATGGIGREIALSFARSGAKVVASGRREAAGRETVAAIAAAGGEALFVHADVTREAEVEALVAAAVDRFGALHFAVNNAGAAMMAGLGELSLADWEQELLRNAGSAFLGIKHQLPAIARAGGGAIVNMASTAASTGLKRMAAYCAAKAAVTGLTRAAAAEGTECNVRVNAISIGPVQSGAWDGTSEAQLQRVAKSIPIGRMGRPEEIANVALWLCSDGASFVTGIVLPADGGSTTMRAETLREGGN